MMVLLFLVSSLSAAEPCRPSLLAVLGQLQQPRPILVEMIGDTTVLTLKDEYDQNMATLVYRTQPHPTRSGTLILVDSVRVEAQYQRRGLSKRLYEEMFRLEPNAVEIESTLMQDNLAAALDGQPLRKDQAREIDEARCIQMVMRTPAFRVRSAAGFVRFSECSVYSFGIVLRMTR